MTVVPPPTSPKILREFSWIMAGAIAGLFGLLLPLLKGHQLPLLPWAIAVVFLLLGLIVPRSLKPVYHLWLKIGHLLGWINSRIILSVIFGLVVTPMALVMKVIKRDTMNRQWQPQLATYRLPCRPRDRQHVEKPY
ncbi:MAG: SxtJ family membrane protein [Synechocystis sp.]